MQSVSLISWSVAAASLRSIKAVPDSIEQALTTVKAAKGDLSKLTVLPFPDHVMQPCSIPSTNLVQLQMTGPLPVNLPECQLSQEPMGRKKYGLNKKHPDLAQLAPLPRQMAEFEKYAKEFIRLDRKARSTATRHTTTPRRSYPSSWATADIMASNSPPCSCSFPQTGSADLRPSRWPRSTASTA